MLLQQLLTKANINTINAVNSFNKELLKLKVTDITANSKLVTQGSIFIATKGYTVDSHLFIKEALKNGAIAVFAEQARFAFLKEHLIELEYLSKIILVDNTKLLINKLCNIFYHKLPQNIVMVTGTNGKTSTVSMVSQLLHHLGIASAQIGTTGIFFNEKSQKLYEKLTTPQVADLFKILAKAKESNINYTIAEASSEGLAEGRLELVPFNIAAFTNLSQDHLNYHKKMECYFNAKSKLFTELLPKNGTAIVNQDDSYGNKLIQACKDRNLNVLSYGKQGENLKLLDVKFQDSGYVVTFYYNSKTYSITLNLLGEFQVYNLLCALLIVLSLKVTTLEQLIEFVPLLKSAKGRLELVREYNGAKIFVDYAHTPEALELALKSLKPLTFGQLYVVFGCGGNRDKAKREIMGRVASNIANFSYITDDNPRNEDPASIRSDIIKGFSNNYNYLNIENREQAIIAAIKNLKNGDILLVAGKGHEEVQIVKNKAIAFSDINVVLNA